MRGAAGPSDRSGDGDHCAGAGGGVSRRCQVSVEDLPICTYHEKDAGKYITAGLAVMRDPETGINNVGIYRHMVHEKNLLGVQLSETADGNIIWQKYEKRGLPCPVAIVIGHHPAFFIGSLVLFNARRRRDQDRRRHVAAAGAARSLQDHSARCAGRRRDRAGVRDPPGRAPRRSAVRRISGHLRAAADESGAGDQGDHPAQKSDLPERLRRPFRQSAAVRV